MAYKYVYIDDTRDAIEQGTINGLQDGGEIEVTFKYPKNWEMQLKELVAMMPDYNGIILDLRLNDNKNEEGELAQYRGSSVAQELRTLAKENLIKNDFPIILISANENMERSLDKTSYDLFDICVNKNTIGNENAGYTYAALRAKLKSLADAYSFLNGSEKTLSAIFRTPENAKIDFRFIDTFNKLVEKPIVHVLARFIDKQIINKPTFLINELYLSARLGVNPNSKDWVKLLDSFLNEAAYTGVFSNYSRRWWMSLVEEFWKSKISTEFNLRNTGASKRVELLIEKTGLKDLTPLTKDEKSKSDCFWVVCKATLIPLDTVDGLTISGQDTNFPWQEFEYISMSEALRPTKNFTVASLEKERLQSLKELFAKNEQRVRT